MTDIRQVSARGYGVVIFGPPGAGKSTIIREISARGITALDLEGTSREYRASLYAEELTADFVGAADTKPSQWPVHRWFRVLLLPARAVYDERRAERDELTPRKAGQGDWYDGFVKGKREYDLVLANNGSVAETVDVLMRLLG